MRAMRSRVTRDNNSQLQSLAISLVKLTKIRTASRLRCGAPHYEIPCRNTRNVDARECSRRLSLISRAFPKSLMATRLLSVRPRFAFHAYMPQKAIRSALVRKIFGGTVASKLVINLRRISRAERSRVLLAALMRTAECLQHVLSPVRT